MPCFAIALLSGLVFEKVLQCMHEMKMELKQQIGPLNFVSLQAEDMSHSEFC